MKTKIISFLFIFLIFAFAGCSKKNNPLSSNNGEGFGILGGGSGTTSVTFNISVVQDQQQNIYFEFTPNSTVTLTSITFNCAAANITNQQVQGDGTTLYSDTNPIDVGPVTVSLQTGQKWTFTVKGKMGSQNGQNYTTNTSYTVK